MISCLLLLLRVGICVCFVICEVSAVVYVMAVIVINKIIFWCDLFGTVVGWGGVPMVRDGPDGNAFGQLCLTNPGEMQLIFCLFGTSAPDLLPPQHTPPHPTSLHLYIDIHPLISPADRLF